MKKSQVLAALALAFALGVVAPVASTHAAMVKIDDKGALVTDEAITDKMEQAIEDGKASCGWHLVSTVKTWYYDQFLALDDALEASEDKIEDQEKFNFDGTGTDAAGNGTTSLKSAYATALTSLNGVLTTQTPALTLPTSLKMTFTDDITDYAKAVKFINDARVEMASKSTQYSSNATVATAYRNVAIDLENALKAADKDIENVKEWASDNLIQPKINAITEADSIDTNVTYAQAVAAAKALNTNNNGTCSIAKALNVEKAVTYAQDLIASQNSFWASEGEKAIENIKKAMNGGTVTDEDVKKPDTADKNDGNKAPDTGILSTEDGGASTTVAMVAGVATALTAAGAGVVAYRNARRSSRK